MFGFSHCESMCKTNYQSRVKNCAHFEAGKFILDPKNPRVSHTCRLSFFQVFCFYPVDLNFKPTSSNQKVPHTVQVYVKSLQQSLKSICTMEHFQAICSPSSYQMFSFPQCPIYSEEQEQHIKLKQRLETDSDWDIVFISLFTCFTANKSNILQHLQLQQLSSTINNYVSF